jgi:hypothetical protein
MSSYAYHGNYCGPGWTAGKYMNAQDAHEDDFDTPAQDALDQICKEHDKAIWQAHQFNGLMKAKKLKYADRIFVRKIKNANIDGPWDDIAAWLVWAMGPGPNLRSFDNFPSSTQDMVTTRAGTTTGTSFLNLHYDRRHQTRDRAI